MNAFAEKNKKIESYFKEPKQSQFKIYGVEFKCSAKEIETIKISIDKMSHKLNINEFIKYEEKQNYLRVFLPKQYAVGSTLYIQDNPAFKITKDKVLIPTLSGLKETNTVSQKEIMIALLYPGRLTEFSGEGCNSESLYEHIGIRQNIVLWSQKLNWGWPDGGNAQWNEEYWDNGTPQLEKKKHNLVESIMDLFLQQELYFIGCYTASKAVYLQSVIDYYARVNPNKKKLDKIVSILLKDGEPFIDLEPQGMWYFEEGFEISTLEKNGKILKIMPYVEPGNFVPGDWNYFRNTDVKTQFKTGYEGSNAIYLGGNLFDDYYNDHFHGYTFERKLDEVYQWRHGVFSRSGNAESIVELSVEERFKLTLSPQKGGLVETYRIVPLFF